MLKRFAQLRRSTRINISFVAIVFPVAWLCNSEGWFRNIALPVALASLVASFVAIAPEFTRRHQTQ